MERVVETRGGGNRVTLDLEERREDPEGVGVVFGQENPEARVVVVARSGLGGRLGRSGPWRVGQDGQDEGERRGPPIKSLSHAQNSAGRQRRRGVFRASS